QATELCFCSSSRNGKAISGTQRLCVSCCAVAVTGFQLSPVRGRSIFVNDLPRSPQQKPPATTGMMVGDDEKKRAIRPVFSNIFPVQVETHFPDDEEQMAPGFRRDDDKSRQTLAASSSVTAFIDNRMRPCLSTSSTLTLTTSPSLSLSETFSTRSLEICDTCTSPSLPGRMVTNAPKSINLTTLPS